MNPGLVCAVNKPILSQIPIVLNKEPEYTDQGTAVCEADGKQRYRCGFRIGGGIDQDPSKSPQGYPDKVSTNRSIDVVSSVCVIQCGHHPRSGGRFVCRSVCLSGRITQKLALRSICFFYTRSITHVARSSSRMIRIWDLLLRILHRCEIGQNILSKYVMTSNVHCQSRWSFV